MRYENGKLLNLKPEYEKKGIEDGSRQIPHLEAEIDHNETELVIKANEHIRPLEKYHDAFIKDKKFGFDNLKNEWAEAKTKTSFEKNIDDEIVSLNNTLEAYYREHQTTLVGVRTDVIVSNAELKKFRVNNKLTRQAVYPLSYMKTAAVMSSIVIGEAVINAYSHQGEGGLIDGAGTAFFISAINVLIAAFFGYWFRCKNHIKVPWRVVGWACFAAFIGSSIYLNSLYATFRTELHKILDEDAVTVTTFEVAAGTTTEASSPRATEENPSQLLPEEVAENQDAKINPQKVAFIRALKKASRIFLGEVPFKDLLSYLTFFLTIIFSVIAFYEGYHLDDAYPGFGKLDRKNKDNKRIDDNEWKEFKPKLDGGLLQAQSDYIAKVESMAYQSPGFVLLLAVELEAKKRELEFDVKQINSELEEVSSIYRHMNNQIRGDEKVPLVFKKPFGPIASIDHINTEYAMTIADIKSYAESYRSEFEKIYMKLSFQKENFKKVSTKAYEEKIKELDDRTQRSAALESAQIAKG